MPETTTLEGTLNVLRENYKKNLSDVNFVRASRHTIYNSLDALAQREGFQDLSTVLEEGEIPSKFKFYVKQRQDPQGNETEYDIFISNGAKSLYFERVRKDPEEVIENIFKDIKTHQKNTVYATAGGIVGAGLMYLLLAPLTLATGGLFLAGAAGALCVGAAHRAQQKDNYKLIRSYAKQYTQKDNYKKGLEALREFSNIFSETVLNPQAEPQSDVQPDPAPQPDAPNPDQVQPDSQIESQSQPNDQQVQPHSDQEQQRIEQRRRDRQRMLQELEERPENQRVDNPSLDNPVLDNPSLDNPVLDNQQLHTLLANNPQLVQQVQEYLNNLISNQNQAQPQPVVN